MARSRSASSSKKQRRDRARRQRLDGALRRMGHETMLRLPAFAAAAGSLTRRLRSTPGAPPRLVAEEDLLATPEVAEMLRTRVALVRQLHGWTEEDAMLEAQQLCCHLQAAANYELSGRKAFWVSGALAELLTQTELDIRGDVLRLPYAACAFVFDDPTTLAIIEGIVAEEDNTLRRGPQPFEVLSVYACPLEDQPGVRLTFLADCLDGEWPLLITRDIPTGTAHNLDEILRSHPAESTDPLFRSESVRRAVHLIINSILYTTSKSFASEPRAPFRPVLGQSARADLTGEHVYYLPAKIVIDQTRGPQPADGADPRRPQTIVGKRFWVRGHWRRPPATWRDQRLRWIRPHLKGADMAVIVERHYSLEARGARASEPEPAPGEEEK